jgi:hypothetical protein
MSLLSLAPRPLSFRRISVFSEVNEILRRMRGLGSILSLLALALFTAFLAVSLPPALSRSLDLLKLARRLRDEPVLDQRVRVWGASYTIAIEEIRRIIPRDASYVIVESEPSPAGLRSGSVSTSRRAGRSSSARWTGWGARSGPGSGFRARPTG